MYCVQNLKAEMKKNIFSKHFVDFCVPIILPFSGYRGMKSTEMRCAIKK